MAMVVQHNMAAANANRQLGITAGAQAKSTEKLSSGYKINRAADDAAGLKISEKMRGQIRGLNRASLNAQDGVSLIQTAEGALNETTSILQRMRELTIQAANDTNVSADRTAIKEELEELEKEVTRIANNTEFNTMKLLNGSMAKANGSKSLQVGANVGQRITFNIGTMTAKALFTAGSDFKTINSGANKLEVDGANKKGANLKVTLGSVIDSKTKKAKEVKFNQGSMNISKYVGSFASATAASMVLDYAISQVSSQRSKLGALQNRLEHTIANLDNVSENTQAAESRIRDTDMAKEMVEYSKNNILAQAGQSMLAQANQSTQGVLSLLG